MAEKEDLFKRPADKIFRDVSRQDYFFISGCVLAYIAAVIRTPPYTPAIVPDSPGYIEFSPLRTALYPMFLGLSLIETAWVQLGLFGLALAYLLTALRRAGFSLWLLAGFVIVLAGNVLFSSFHSSILPESIYFSVSVIAVGAWIDYFRTGRVKFLLVAGIALGFMIGIRPIGISIVPLHVLAAWIRRPRNVSRWPAIALVVLPIGIGVVTERLVYHAVHGGERQSVKHVLMVGLAAMLIKPDMTFTGPHAAALNALGAQMNAAYEPVHRYLDNAPSLPVRTILSTAYQGGAFPAFADQLAETAKAQHTTVADLSFEIAGQAVRQNLRGYLRLTLLNYVGQWSVSARNFPSTSRMLADYVDSHAPGPPSPSVDNEFTHASPTSLGLVVYPAFLAAGAVTLVLSIVFLIFLRHPALMERADGFYIGIAAFFSAMCQSYTLFMSLVNGWTPRYLMGVFPQIEIVALCLIAVCLLRWKIRTRPQSSRAA
jgi:hypothetical protein